MSVRSRTGVLGKGTPRVPPSGSGGGAFLAPVDTIARASAGRLVDISTGLLPDGAVVFVRSVRDFFVLDKNSTETSDNITIADGNGGGRWGRRFEPDVEWLTQAEWNIDPAAADDEGDGSAGDPLQTHAELGRRAFKQGWVIRQSVLVNIAAGGLPESDPVEIDVAVDDPNVLLRYVGAPTVVQTGTLTDATALVSGTALPTIEDTVGGLGAGNLGQRVRLTSGANAGAIAWALRDDGSDTLTTSAFATTPKTAQPVTGIPTLGGPTPGGGDDYALETLPAIFLSRVKIAQPEGVTTSLLFDTLSVGDAGAAFIATSLDRLLLVDGVLFGALVRKGDLLLTDVLVRGTSQVGGAAVVRAGAIFILSVLLGAEAVIELSHEHTAVGESLITGGVADYTIAGPTSAHDAPTAGLQLTPTVRVTTAGLIWGTGNGTYGIDAAGGQLFYDPGLKPTVTAAINDTRVGGAPTAYAQIPALNGGDGSAVVESP